VSGDSIISADARSEGNGGRVIVWADRSNEFFGNISARGGSNSGDGGLVEVSGKEFLNFKGTVDTFAPNGNTGTLLLDPSTLTIIDEAEGGTQDDNLLTDDSILSNDPDIGANTVSWGAINSLGAGTDIVLQATGDITIANITGAVSDFNNSVFLNLTTGSLSITSTAGSISFVDTNDAIQTQGGAVTLSAVNGNITAGTITTVSGGGYGNANNDSGAITLDAGGNITTGFLNSSSSNGDAGNITITAGGSIVASSFDSSYFSLNNAGNGGAIRLTAGGDITTTGISQQSSSNSGNAGEIRFTAGGSISTGGLDSSASGTGGRITLIAQNNINTRELDSSGGVRGGDVTLISQSGSIDTSNTLLTDGVIFGGTLDTSSTNGNGGAITLTAPGNITAANVNSLSAGADSKSGDITVNAGGNFTAPSVISIWQGATTGNGGDINITAGGNISSQGDFLTFTDNGNGGKISLTAGGNIFTDDIYSNQQSAFSGQL
jgi:hypothetical protein